MATEYSTVTITKEDANELLDIGRSINPPGAKAMEKPDVVRFLIRYYQDGERLKKEGEK